MPVLFALVIAFYATRFLYLRYSPEWYNLAIFAVVCFYALMYFFTEISGATTKVRKVILSRKGGLVLAGGVVLVVGYHFFSEYSNWLVAAGGLLIGAALLLAIIGKRSGESQQALVIRGASDITTTSRESGFLTSKVDNLLERFTSEDRTRTVQVKTKELQAQNLWAGEVEKNYGWQRTLWGKQRADPKITGRTKTAEDVKDVAEKIKLAEKKKELKDLNKKPPSPAEPPKPEPTPEEKIQRLEARWREIDKRQDVRAAMSVENLPAHKQMDFNTEGINLDAQKRDIDKKLDTLRKLIV